MLMIPSPRAATWARVIHASLTLYLHVRGQDTTILIKATTSFPVSSPSAFFPSIAQSSMFKASVFILFASLAMAAPTAVRQTDIEAVGTPAPVVILNPAAIVETHRTFLLQNNHGLPPASSAESTVNGRESKTRRRSVRRSRHP
ncbi:hypothetical protein C8J56DRAFT_1158028 [Mycena floridula]|nr:hypothetical protein C8J56DRAFT_1158028 [Mycena floridula]